MAWAEEETNGAIDAESLTLSQGKRVAHEARYEVERAIDAKKKASTKISLLLSAVLVFAV